MPGRHGREAEVVNGVAGKDLLSESDPARPSTVVLGVTGGIAAYKAVELLRILMDAGLHVIPVLTEDAARFVGPVTFSALASEPALVGIFGGPDASPHTSLARRADLVVVAPATARFIGLLAAGIPENLLLATAVATKAPVVVCPAMHTEMWENVAVSRNVETLGRLGVRIVPPEVGRLAGGDEGIGRLAEPETIAAEVFRLLAWERGTGAAGGDAGAAVKQDLAGCKVVVTAGGTREAVDAARVLTNRSSGKQGYAIAEAARLRGAEVTLVTAADRTCDAGIAVVRVESALDMEAAVVPLAATADVIVMAAAVADFRPAEPVAGKIHRGDGEVMLRLVANPDILAGLGEQARPGLVLVGFAAEVGMDEAGAAAKLDAKKADLIVLNDISARDCAFDSDVNRAIIFGSDGRRVEVPRTGKDVVAHLIWDNVVELLGERGHG